MKNLKTIITLLLCSTMTSIAFAANIIGTITYDKPNRLHAQYWKSKRRSNTVLMLQKVLNLKNLLFQKAKVFRTLLFTYA